MGADAADLDVHAVGGGRDDVERHRNGPRWLAGRDVEGERVVGTRETFVEAVLQHLAGAEDALLGGLDHEDEGARPAVAAVHHLAGGSDESGDVHVVAAGVHDRLFDPGGVDLAGDRGVVETGPLLDGQAVHVGAHQDRRSLAVLKHGDDAGAADAGGHLIAERAEFAGHAGGGHVFEPGEFRVAVEVVEQVRQIGVVVGLDGRSQILALSLGARRQHGPGHSSDQQPLHRPRPLMRRGQ